MMRTMGLLVVALAVAAPFARADDATAHNSFFEDGERAYNLGQFEKAAELFRKAYEARPEPAYLFNLAQTYRQAGNCRQASFFYKRFLGVRDQDTKKPIEPEMRTEVEKRIAELDECMKRELANKPPTELDKGEKTTGQSTSNTAAQTAMVGGREDAEAGGEDGGEPAGPTVAAPTMLSLRVGLGVGILRAGDLDKKPQFATSLAGGYPLSLGDKLRLDLGALVTFMPVRYTTTMMEDGSGALIGFGANVAPMIEVAPKITLRADVAIGVQVFSGLGKMGNPFTNNGDPASGALSSLLVRAAVGGEYAVTPNVTLMLAPFAFSYSPAPAGFDSKISSLTTISFYAGIGYQR